MSEHAVMPLGDYQEACASFRHYLGTTDEIKSIELAPYIGAVHEKGFSEGQLDAVQSADALKGSLSDIGIVTAKDVSPYEHAVNVSLTSDTITDFSSLTLMRYGKNLYPEKNFRRSGKPSYSYNQWQCDSLTSIADLLVGKKITVSVTVENNSTNGARIFMRWNAGSSYPTIGDLSIARGVSGRFSLTTTVTKRPTPDAKLQILLYYSTSEPVDTENAVTYTQLQVELGSEATPFEEYITPVTYSVNADGSVEGITSLYPSMTLRADNTEVNVNAEYTKDIDAAFNALEQQILLLGGTV